MPIRDFHVQPRRLSNSTLQSWNDLLSEFETGSQHDESEERPYHSSLRPVYARPALLGMICLVLISWFGLKDMDIVSSHQQQQHYPPTAEADRLTSIQQQNEIRGAEGHYLSIPHSEVTTNQASNESLSTTSSTMKHRILSLGGSTTWGAKLDSRSQAYPHVLASKLGADWDAVNLAVRATGASYASQCIETMIREGEGSADSDNADFDVILIEYSLNGLEGIDLLLQRLRRRYPSAILVYVHLWSLRMSVHNAITYEKPRQILNQGLKFTAADEAITTVLADPTAQWAWSDSMVSDSKEVSIEAFHAIAKVDGYVYELQRPDSPMKVMEDNWFGPDYHHLSTKGHEIVAQGIMSLVHHPETKVPPLTKLKFHDRSWGKGGDQCFSWYETGKTESVEISGGTMKMFVKPDKWALHIGQRFGAETKLTFFNNSKEKQPVELFFMSWGDPSIYPKSTITLTSEDNASISSMTLDPLHPIQAQRIYHITNTVRVGWAAPGLNSLRVVPNETTQRPLRITGIVICGACEEMKSGP
jgi:hypothetical protein